ncbi:hypothetical protein Sme01_25600 [Sphaerisporangium melleum]|uniref:DUF3068 domain-containing protein n=1 Tax=Sphaerisporangium melleum TaxID=321316 RepID=A0A917QRM8_9ACTN|nr:DUF3068 domain-containing protein [Sphaerisporangium melleum]GGK64414.1 hypothetical protein GCM10007964_04340 [Sphaerisporangium melleum]GII70084.1 hypothetical protein Sme01_25600 [Sphaerisporangium melleum]
MIRRAEAATVVPGNHQARGPGSTRVQLVRTACAVLVAFLVTMAVLWRWYVYPGGLTLPSEQRTVYRLVDDTATYLDTATFQTRTGVPVTETVSLYGDPPAGDDRTAVWVEFSSLEAGSGPRIDYHERRTAFDRRTGLAVNCCGAYIDDDSAVRQTGLAFRLPHRAEPRGYPMFDPVLKREVALRYEGEEEVAGLPVRRYSYSIGPAKVQDLPGQVPARVLGLPGTRPVDVARYVRITRTFWVEPESGLPVRVREQRADTLRTPDQVDRAVAFRADLVTAAGDVEDQAAVAGAFRRWAVLVRDVLPAVFLVLALVSLAVALGAGRRRKTPPTGHDPHSDQTPRPDQNPSSVEKPGSRQNLSSDEKPGSGQAPGADRNPRPDEVSTVTDQADRPPATERSAAAQDDQQVPGHDLADAG